MTLDVASKQGAATSKKSDEGLSTSLYLGFGVGTLGVSLVLNVTSSLLAPFMTNFLGLGAGLVAALFFGSKIYDMITDPMMGIISDRTKSRWGRRRPWIVAGSFVAAIGFIMLFSPPSFDDQAVLVGYIVVAFLITYTGYTMFNVPYLAMPAEMTDNYHARTNIMTFRTLFITIGQSLAAGTFWIVQQLGNDRAAHGEMAVFLAVVIAGSGALCFWATAPARQTMPNPKVIYSFKDQLASAARNKPYILLITMKFCQLLGLASVNVSMAYFVTLILGLDYAAVTLFLLTKNVSIFVAIPFWNRLSKRIGKRDSCILSTIGYAVVSLSWLLADPGDPTYLFYARSVLFGIAISGLLIMSPAMLPDTMEYDYLRTGLRREGIFASLYTTVEKAAFAIGPALVLSVFSMLGYVPSTEGLTGEQPESALTAIYVGIAIIPSLAYSVSIICLLMYDLTEEKLKTLEAGGKTE